MRLTRHIKRGRRVLAEMPRLALPSLAWNFQTKEYEFKLAFYATDGTLYEVVGNQIEWEQAIETLQEQFG